MITYNVKITVWCLTLFSWAAASGCHWFKSDFSQRSLMKRSRASRRISIWIANQPITGSSMHLDMSMMCRQLAELRGEHQNGEEMGWEWLWVSWTQSWAPDGLVWVFDKLPICWDFHTVANSTGITEDGPKRSKHPVVCRRMPCWCQRSEEHGPRHTERKKDRKAKWTQTTKECKIPKHLQPWRSEHLYTLTSHLMCILWISEHRATCFRIWSKKRMQSVKDKFMFPSEDDC